MKKIFGIILIVAALAMGTATYSFAGVTAMQEPKQIAEGQYMLEMIVTASSTGFVETATAIDGLIYEVETDPGATAPTDEYDLTLTHVVTGLDIMGGNLADRSATLPQRADPLDSKTQPSYGKYNLNVTNNLVNGAQFTVRIFYFR